MAAFVFNGVAPTPYPWGVVQPGDVGFFEHRAPNGDWSPFEPAAAPVPDVDDEEPVDTGADPADGEVRQPNKAASAEDWKAYAAADGSFEVTTGIHPDDATRKAIVDHYSGSDL